MAGLLAPVGAGELIDRITILSLKAARFKQPRNRAAAAAARDALRALRDAGLPRTPALAAQEDALYDVNAELWDIENLLRAHEARQDFGPAFVALARAVYRENDRRAAIKARIDALCGAPTGDPKEHPSY